MSSAEEDDYSASTADESSSEDWNATRKKKKKKKPAKKAAAKAAPKKKKAASKRKKEEEEEEEDDGDDGDDAAPSTPSKRGPPTKRGKPVDYHVAASLSARSKCRTCSQTITESVRVEKLERLMMPSFSEPHLVTRHYHVTCFAFHEQDADDVNGFEDMTEELQKEFARLFKKVAGKDKGDLYLDAMAKSPTKKAGVTAAAYEEAMAKYNKMNLNTLKDLMRENNQMVSGTKVELVARAVDGSINGALPSCPEHDHDRAKLHIDPNTGEFFCKGAYEEDRGHFMKCSYRTKTIARQPWKDL